jgi:hypothetical protein
MDPIKIRTAKILKMFHRMDSRGGEEIKELRLRVRELEAALEVHKANERSLQKIIDGGKFRTSLISRRKSVAIPQQQVVQVQQANLTRRHSLRKSFADESILNAFRCLPDLDSESPTLRKISVSVMKLHFDSPLLGVKLITKPESRQSNEKPPAELVVEFKDPKEGITFRKYALVRPSVLEHVAFWCDIHKFPTDAAGLKEGRKRSESMSQK